MSIFETLGKKQVPQNGNPIQQAMQYLRSNPIEVLKRSGLNVPQGMSDPQQMVQYLLQSEQLTNPRLQIIQRIAGQLFR